MSCVCVVCILRTQGPLSRAWLVFGFRRASSTIRAPPWIFGNSSLSFIPVFTGQLCPWPLPCVRRETSAPDPASPTSISAGTQAAIVFIKEPSSQDALQGRRALLRCEVEAPGPVQVTWLLNGVPVRDTERRFAQGSSLSFAAVDRLQDSGAFQCVARDNVTGEEARSTNASFNIKCESLFGGRRVLYLVHLSDSATESWEPSASVSPTAS